MKVSSQARRVSALIIAVTAVIAAVAGTASATHSWNNYHWFTNGANPLELSLAENLSSDWEPYLQEASADWSVSPVLETTVVLGKTNPKICRATTGRVEVCNAKYGMNGWLGLAQIWLQDGHIIKGVAKMNDTYFTMPRYNTPTERLHVMCQEVGHTFGLGHTSEDGTSQGTCMDYSEDPGSTKPNAHDYEQLDVMYGRSHPHDGVVIYSDAPGASGTEVDERHEWGRQVESHDGHEVFIRHFGNGLMLVTAVTNTK